MGVPAACHHAKHAIATPQQTAHPEHETPCRNMLIWLNIDRPWGLEPCLKPSQVAPQLARKGKALKSRRSTIHLALQASMMFPAGNAPPRSRRYVRAASFIRSCVQHVQSARSSRSAASNALSDACIETAEKAGRDAWFPPAQG